MKKYIELEKVKKLLVVSHTPSLEKVVISDYLNAWAIEVSEDAISRENLRKSLTRPLENNNTDEMYWKGWHDCTVAVETRIADAPSVVPQPKESECPYFIDEVWCNLVGKEIKGANDE